MTFLGHPSAALWSIRGGRPQLHASRLAAAATSACEISGFIINLITWNQRNCQRCHVDAQEKVLTVEDSMRLAEGSFNNHTSQDPRIVSSSNKLLLFISLSFVRTPQSATGDQWSWQIFGKIKKNLATLEANPFYTRAGFGLTEKNHKVIKQALTYWGCTDGRPISWNHQCCLEVITPHWAKRLLWHSIQGRLKGLECSCTQESLPRLHDMRTR